MADGEFVMMMNVNVSWDQYVYRQSGKGTLIFPNKKMMNAVVIYIVSSTRTSTSTGTRPARELS